MSILQAADIKKYYGTEPNITKALDGVSLTIEQGEFVAIVGTSGSGKSTLLHMMGGLDIPTSGSVKIRDKELSQMNNEQLTIFRRRNIGFIFQSYNLVPILNVRENIVLPVELDGDTVDEAFLAEIVRMLALGISGTEWVVYDVVLTLLSGALNFIVIGAALRKPSKILASFTPVEAMKYRGSFVVKGHNPLKRITPDALAKNNLSVNRKKNRMAVISLSISGILMIALAILITSLNLPARLLEDYPLNEDFQIGVQIDNLYERFPQVIRNNPLSEELVNEIAAIQGVDKVIRDECVIGRLIEPEIAEDADDNIELIESVSTGLLANISEVVSGSADYNKIGTDGIIINKYRTDHSSIPYDKIKVGDTLRFQFDSNGERSEKTFRVIGIAYFPSTGLFYTSPEVIHAISPYNNATHLSVVCDGSSTENIRTQLQNMISRNPNLTLHIYEEDYQMFQYYISAIMSSLYGVSALIMVFGLLNMANILINSAAMRKREFALLQAVGMTNKQLRKMLYREGAGISVKAAAIAIFFGVICGGLLCYLANEIMSLKFIIFQVSILPILTFALLLIGLQMIVSICICKSTERAALTERLRTE